MAIEKYYNLIGELSKKIFEEVDSEIDAIAVVNILRSCVEASINETTFGKLYDKN